MEIYSSDQEQPILDWQWLEPSLRNITHLIMRNVPPRGGRALDVGCGTGRVASLLAQRGYEVDGIDIEPRVVEIANRLNDAHGWGCRFRVGDCREAEAVPSNHYDLVVCSEVLEHVQDYTRIIENIHASLKEGGRAVISVPYDSRKFSVLDTYGGHVRRFDLERIETDLRHFYLRKVIITGFPFYRLMVRVYLLLLRFRGASHSNEVLWQGRSMRLVAHLTYPFVRLDNLFAFTRLGDALVLVAEKPAARQER